MTQEGEERDELTRHRCRKRVRGETTLRLAHTRIDSVQNSVLRVLRVCSEQEKFVDEDWTGWKRSVFEHFTERRAEFSSGPWWPFLWVANANICKLLHLDVHGIWGTIRCCLGPMLSRKRRKPLMKQMP